jgi:hypothetical protein
MEVFVFLAAVNDMSKLECIPLQASPQDSGDENEMKGDASAQGFILDLFRKFTVDECKCHSSDTRDRLLSIIEAGCGTLDGFDTLMREMEITFFNASALSRQTTAASYLSSAGSRFTRIPSKSVTSVSSSKEEPLETIGLPTATEAEEDLLCIRV